MSASRAAEYIAAMALRRRSAPLKALGAPYKAARRGRQAAPPPPLQLHSRPHVRQVGLDGRPARLYDVLKGGMTRGKSPVPLRQMRLHQL